MRFLKKRRLNSSDDGFEDDPLSGVANIFDIAVVFITALLATLFSVYGLKELMDEKSNLTITKQSSSGEMEIITKKGTTTKALKVTGAKIEGRGERLGTAYRLENGSVIYVPDEK